MKVEFGIHVVEQEGLDKARLYGRVFSGNVHLGTQFTASCEIEDASPGVSPRRTLIAALALSVIKIETYGRAVDELDEGLTGGIEVQGEGVGFLKPGTSIASESPAPVRDSPPQ